MGYVNKVNDDVGTHLIEPTLFAVAGGTSAAYTAAINNFTLVEGVIVNVKFETTNAAEATLNVSSTGAKAILYMGAAIFANAFITNGIYSFVCTQTNGTYYWELLNDLPVDDRIELVNMMEGT